LGALRSLNVFGFSLPKLLFTVLIIGAVWYGFKLLGRGGGRGEEQAANDTIRCKECGAFVSAESPENCGKTDCPFAS